MKMLQLVHNMSIKKEFKSLDIKIGKEKFIKIDIEEKEQLKYLSNIADFILKSNLEISDEKKSEVKIILENIAWTNKREEVVKAIVSEITSMKEEEYATLYHNPSATQNKDVKPEIGVVSEADKSMQELLDLEG